MTPLSLKRSVITHTTNTAAKQLRVERGSRPAARRQRKRIAAARVAAAASVSPPHQEETSSPCDSTDTAFEQFSPLIRRTDHSDHNQTDAMCKPTWFSRVTMINDGAHWRCAHGWSIETRLTIRYHPIR